ncbi:chromosome segregation protein SMC [Peptoniphilus sp. KCTC 25270]|uniref:chromosome segregation protein SMC n=1 Tax=Peptoniphilus sp. KCTC 25270 TaxID=2897414 RepID=UPI001E3DBF5C|nr:chromosome segregation protein SMC [Peptoniphilus sp. KCTC 25270]MCD1147067.1 chromosome segregation protein SMC [Peptoniphilus sp. KCTC 25270]
MHLNQMELFGFKSFAKRTKIHFTDGITGVVGPNGSGKSNIIDAIMWALGETSAKQLRGSKMEDVIFGGTDTISPLGYAEVILYFNNKDQYLPMAYEEISIKRKMFRSGESEFYINKQKVRLKDVRELFMDTGIGKDGYSFIGQGQIDQILSNRPQDRRAVFEEAAGITKFKTRKEESERSLNKTLDNLLRIDDILREVASQEKHLKVESEKALTVMEKRKEKEKILSQFLTKKEKEIQGKVQEIQEKIEGNNQILQSKLEVKEQLAKDQEAGTQRILELEEAVEDLQQKRIEKVRHMEEIKGKLSNFTYKKESMVTQGKEWGEKILENEEKIHGLQEELREISSQKTALTFDLDKEKESLDFLEKDYEKKNGIFESEKEKAFELERQGKANFENRSKLLAKRDSLEYFLKERSERKENLLRHLQSFQGQEKEVIEEIEKRQKEMDSYLEKKENLSKEKEQREQERNSLAISYNEGLERLRKLTGTHESMKREWEFSKKVLENFEGYSHSVRNFLKNGKNQEWYEEILGPVAENIVVKTGYETAISVALGGGAQNIIIESNQKVSQMIDFLKNHKMGRITFYPLNTIEPRSIESGLRNRTTVDFQIALDCVRYDEKIHAAIGNLLGRILVVNSIEEGKKLSRELNQKYKIVTTSGELFQIGGSITGGSIRNNQTDLYNRKNEIEAKRQSIKEIEKSLEKEKEILEKIKFQGEEIQSQNQFVEEEIEKLTKSILYLEKIFERSISSKESIHSRIEELDKQVQDENLQMENNVLELREIEEEILFLNQEEEKTIPTPSNHLSEWEAKVKEVFGNLHQSRLKVSEYSGLLRELTLREDQVVKEINNYSKENQNLAQRKIEKEKEWEEETFHSQEWEKTLQEELQEKNAIEEQMEKLFSEKKDFQEQLKAKEEELEKLFLALTRLNRQEEQYKVRLENYSSEREEILQEMEETISPFDRENNTFDTETSLEELNKNLKKVERELSSFGPINENSIEEYKEVSERLLFLTHQKEDLSVSKNKLEGVIKRLEKEMRILFQEAIGEIQIYFNEIFKILFNGGKAEVHLEEQEDLLESGIEIRVQPPGKKLQSLSLLSGGERSMTAVALLFALLKRRKSPFCILDEIDAALDEANIKRYTSYLQKMDDIQFIMITHRKSTMEIADYLYGVTMQEKGVSSVLSMELEEANQHVGLDKKEVQI